MNEFEFEIPNFAKYNPRKDVAVTTWFRASNTTFHDSKFARLSTTAKLLWFYYLAERSRANHNKISTSVILVGRHTGFIRRLVKSATTELESNQMLVIHRRDADVPHETDRQTNKTNETDSSKALRKRTQSKASTQSNEEKLLQKKSNSAKTETPQKKITTSKLNTSKTWQAFSNAYRKRYGSEPVRNASTNSQMLNFVKRIGETESPDVAEYYVTLNEVFYANAGHSTGILLRDCEKIRMLWATGKRTTAIDPKTAFYHEQLSAIRNGEI